MRSESPGFALVEAVVALAIVAAILGVTFQTISSAGNAAREAQARRSAMLEARSLAAQLGATLPLAPGTAEGRSGPWRWRVDIDPVGGRELEAPLNHVAISVSDQRAHRLARLETLRLAR